MTELNTGPNSLAGKRVPPGYSSCWAVTDGAGQVLDTTTAPRDTKLFAELALDHLGTVAAGALPVFWVSDDVGADVAQTPLTDVLKVEAPKYLNAATPADAGDETVATLAAEPNKKPAPQGQGAGSKGR